MEAPPTAARSLVKCSTLLGLLLQALEVKQCEMGRFALHTLSECDAWVVGWPTQSETSGAQH